MWIVTGYLKTTESIQHEMEMGESFINLYPRLFLGLHYYLYHKLIKFDSISMKVIELRRCIWHFHERNAFR